MAAAKVAIAPVLPIELFLNAVIPSALSPVWQRSVSVADGDALESKWWLSCYWWECLWGRKMHFKSFLKYFSAHQHRQQGGCPSAFVKENRNGVQMGRLPTEVFLVNIGDLLRIRCFSLYILVFLFLLVSYSGPRRTFSHLFHMAWCRVWPPKSTQWFFQTVWEELVHSHKNITSLFFMSDGADSKLNF